MPRKGIQVILFLNVVLLLSLSARAQEIRKEAWPTENAVSEKLNRINITVDPELPAPVLHREPEFTWGTSNTIFWSSDSVRTIAQTYQYTLRIFEAEAQYLLNGSSVTLWGFVSGSTGSATFNNLPEAVPISYRLRYYAEDDTGGFHLSYWSAAVISRQDISAPIIDTDSSGIVGVEDFGTQRWIVGNEFYLRVAASDPSSGKVMQVAIQEENYPATYTTIIPPQAEIDTLIFHELKTAAKTPVTISWWVVDVALQTSEKQMDTIIWMPPNEAEDKLICFPNPFNPEQNGRVKILCGISQVTAAHIYDPFGNHVIELKKSISDNFFSWDGKNGNGEMVGSGGYLCVIEGKGQYYCKIAVYR